MPPNPTTSPTVTVHAMARAGLGFDRLRPAQARAAEALVAGRDAVVVMPTGSGKSAVYQVAAALIDGPTVVVSPLIALQRDQLDALADADLGEAAAANSLMGAAEKREVLDDLRAGDLEFLFVAPEQLANEETMAALRENPPSLFVVDEAHCVSEWGHDFRPEYLRLGEAARALGRPVIVALTATASPIVRAEIIERLHLEDPLVMVEGFDRPNIGLAVETHTDPGHQRADLVERTLSASRSGVGLVYVATRKQTAEIAAELADHGLRTAAYHGGLRRPERDSVHERFMADELDVVVATTAFGMGIDKPNVRFVHHLHVPESVDAYYQEIGRAGRDGDPAEAVLFWRAEDLGRRAFFAGSAPLDEEVLRAVAVATRDAEGPVDAPSLAGELGLRKSQVVRVLDGMAIVGATRVRPGGRALWTHLLDVDGAVAAVAEQEDRRRQWRKSRLDMMRNYAEASGCRRAVLLSYFGEQAPDRCERCDRCTTLERGARPTLDVDDGLVTAEIVVHATFGRGQVLRREGDTVVVLFDDAGYRSLSAELVTEAGLIEPAS
jgi:ATP-dependent DNA helicase RecQ